MKMEEFNKINRKATKIRRLILRMTTIANSGHPGGSLSSADIIATLFFHYLNYKNDDPNWEYRDRFILSKGHCAPVLYGALALAGYFPINQLDELRKINSCLQGHPCSTKTPGVEISTGSLGQGLSISCGLATGLHMSNNSRSNVFVLMGDGELNEGQVWEGAMFANHYSLANLIAIIDHNNFQVDGRTSDIMNTNPLIPKWESFGWKAEEIDGHDIRQIVESIGRAISYKNGPYIIIANTIKGKGVSFLENNNAYHGKALTKEQLELALKELKGENNGT